MCTGLELLAAGSLVAGAYGASRMKAPPRIDPVAEREAAESEAQRKANTAIAFQKKALRDNSLFTGGGTTGSSQSTLGVG
jgi:hypothetical protein